VGIFSLSHFRGAGHPCLCSPASFVFPITAITRDHVAIPAIGRLCGPPYSHSSQGLKDLTQSIPFWRGLQLSCQEPRANGQMPCA